MPVNKWICPRESGYNLFMSIQLNQEEKLDDPSQWVHWNYVILSVSWINLCDSDLDILISWILQLKIWSRGSSVLWLIWKSAPFWYSSARGSFCLGSTLWCELTTSTCQIQPGGCSLPQELTDVPDEDCLWQHDSYKKKRKEKKGNYLENRNKSRKL